MSVLPARAGSLSIAQGRSASLEDFLDFWLKRVGRGAR